MLGKYFQRKAQRFDNDLILPMREFKDKKILLISHNLNIEGAPISLLLIGSILIKNGFSVDVLSLREGQLKENYLSLGIQVFNISDKFDYNEYDLIIANTVLTYKYINLLKDKVPSIWFIRESKNIMDFEKIYPDLAINIHYMPYIYCVSEMAKNFIDSRYRQKVKVLHNFCLDSYRNIENTLSDKVQFTFVGTLCSRKGIEILLNVFNNLNAKYANKYQLNIIGKFFEETVAYKQKLKNKIKSNPNIIYHGIKLDNEKQELYEKTNVFVIPSLEEPASRVAIEACMIGRPLIVTQNVGAKYLVTPDTGWVVKTGDIESLKKCIEKILDNKFDLIYMGKKAREMYLNTSSLEIYKKEILKIINFHISKNLICQKSIVELFQNFCLIFKSKITNINLIKTVKYLITQI